MLKLSMATQKNVKNINITLSKIPLDVACCLLPQITQKRICENLRNLRLKTRASYYKMSAYTLHVNN